MTDFNKLYYYVMSDFTGRVSRWKWEVGHSLINDKGVKSTVKYRVDAEHEPIVHRAKNMTISYAALLRRHEPSPSLTKEQIKSMVQQLQAEILVIFRTMPSVEAVMAGIYLSMPEVSKIIK